MTAKAPVKVKKIGGKYVVDVVPDDIPTTSPEVSPVAPAAPGSELPNSSEPSAVPDNPVVVAPVPPAIDPAPAVAPAPAKLSPLPVTLPNQAGPAERDNSLAPYTLAEEVPLEKKNRQLYTIGILLFILVMGATGTLFYFRTRLPENASDTAPVVTQPSPTTTTVTPSVAPTSTALVRAAIKLEVLNGTKTPGLAGQTATVFTELGYEVVKTGNSPDDATENLLYVDQDLEDQLTVLLADVLKELDIASVSGYLEDSTASARIVLGAE